MGSDNNLMHLQLGVELGGTSLTKWTKAANANLEILRQCVCLIEAHTSKFSNRHDKDGQSSTAYNFLSLLTT
jgi:hypothetical protein